MKDKIYFLGEEYTRDELKKEIKEAILGTVLMAIGLPSFIGILAWLVTLCH